MKCDKCEKEAMLHYTFEINGEKSECHLCANCANEEGFGEMLNFRPRPMFDGFFASPFGMLSDGFFGGRLLTPTLLVPRLMIKVDGEPQNEACDCKLTETAPGKTDNIPEDAGEEIKLKRELFQLKRELKSAVEAEEFEKAAELRDKIREMEK